MATPYFLGQLWHLHQCWSSVPSDDFTYIKVVNKWHYLYIVVNWFSHKIITWNISSKLDIDLVMTVLKKLVKNVTILKDLCSIRIKEHNTQPFHSGSYWILLMLYNHFQRRLSFL